MFNKLFKILDIILNDDESRDPEKNPPVKTKSKPNGNCPTIREGSIKKGGLNTGPPTTKCPPPAGQQNNIPYKKEIGFQPQAPYEPIHLPPSGGSNVIKNIIETDPFSNNPFKTEVFCKDCEYYNFIEKTGKWEYKEGKFSWNEYWIDDCNSLDNKFFETEKNFYEEKSIIKKKKPSEINKNNDCKFYKKKENDL